MQLEDFYQNSSYDCHILKNKNIQVGQLIRTFFFLFLNIEGNSDEIRPIKENFEEVFNIGTMLSHDDKFTLYFKTRDKAVLAKGQEINYIKDYPQE